MVIDVVVEVGFVERVEGVEELTSDYSASFELLQSAYQVFSLYDVSIKYTALEDVL